MKKNETNFTTGKIISPLIMFSFPLFLGNILQQLYSIADSIIVGQILGSQALASIGVTSPVTHLVNSLMMGLSMGVSVSISQFAGAKETGKLKTVIHTSILFFFLLSLALTIIGIFTSHSILGICKAPANIEPMACIYLQITFLGTIMSVGYQVVNAIFRGLGNSLYPLLFLIISSLANIILDLVFVLCLHLGVPGTAWATIIAQGISFLWALLSLRRSYPQYTSSHEFSGTLLKRCLSIGIPSSLKGSAYWLGNILLMSLISSYGPIPIAGYSIASKIDAFIQTPMASLSQALSSFVGQNIGGRKPERIKKGVITSQSFGVAFSIFMTILVHHYGNNLLGLFAKDADVIAIGLRYLKIVSTFYVIYALQEVIQGVAIGAGDTIVLFCSTILAMWALRIPLAYHLSAKYGTDGIWYSMASGWFVAMIICNGYYLSGRWKRKMTTLK